MVVNVRRWDGSRQEPRPASPGWDVCDGGPGLDVADATREVQISIP
jgi:hypothetical protein